MYPLYFRSKFQDNFNAVEASVSNFDSNPRFLQLSPEEQASVRKYDVDKNGVLTFEEVMLLLEDFKKLKTKNANMKRYVIGCTVLIVLLSISNLGTAMAAAYLAKETTIGSNGALETVDGRVVTTASKANFQLSPAMGNMKTPSLNNRRLSDGSVVLGCVSNEMKKDMTVSLQGGATGTIEESNEDGSTITHQLTTNGMVVTESMVQLTCTGMKTFTLVADEEGICSNGRRKLWWAGQDLWIMKRIVNAPA